MSVYTRLKVHEPSNTVIIGNRAGVDEILAVSAELVAAVKAEAYKVPHKVAIQVRIPRRQVDWLEPEKWRFQSTPSGRYVIKRIDLVHCVLLVKREWTVDLWCAFVPELNRWYVYDEENQA